MTWCGSRIEPRAKCSTGINNFDTTAATPTSR